MIWKLNCSEELKTLLGLKDFNMDLMHQVLFLLHLIIRLQWTQGRGKTHTWNVVTNTQCHEITILLSQCNR
jgi:hypothetical protein